MSDKGKLYDGDDEGGGGTPCILVIAAPIQKCGNWHPLTYYSLFCLSFLLLLLVLPSNHTVSLTTTHSACRRDYPIV